MSTVKYNSLIQQAAAKLRRGIRMQLKELYADALSKRRDTIVSQQLMTAKVRQKTIA